MPTIHRPKGLLPTPDPSSPYAELDDWLSVPLSEREKTAEDLKFGSLHGDAERLPELLSAPKSEFDRIKTERSQFLTDNPTFTYENKSPGVVEKYVKPAGKAMLDLVPGVGSNLFPRPQSSKPADAVPSNLLPDLAPQVHTPPKPDQPQRPTNTPVLELPDVTIRDTPLGPTPTPMTRKRTTLNPDDEDIFQSWYADIAKQTGMNPNPDAPQHKYDMRAFWQSGQEPAPDPTDIDPVTKQPRLHFSSEFKDDDHPNRFVLEDDGNLMDTKSGKALTDPNAFNALATPEQKATVEESMRSKGLLIDDASQLPPDLAGPVPTPATPSIDPRTGQRIPVLKNEPINRMGVERVPQIVQEQANAGVTNSIDSLAGVLRHYQAHPEQASPLNAIAMKAREMTGRTEKIDLITPMADLLSSVANSLRHEKKPITPESVPELVAAGVTRFVTETAPELAVLRTMTGNMALAFGVHGLLKGSMFEDAEGKPVFAGLNMHGAKSALINLATIGILHGLAPTSRVVRAGAGAVIGGGVTASEGGSPEQVVADAITFAAMSGISPGNPDFMTAWRAQRQGSNAPRSAPTDVTPKAGLPGPGNGGTQPIPPDLGPLPRPAGPPAQKAPRVGDKVNDTVQKLADQFPPSLEIQPGGPPKLIKKAVPQGTVPQGMVPPEIAPIPASQAPALAPETVQTDRPTAMTPPEIVPPGANAEAESPTVEEIHALADKKGVPWDDSKPFMDFTEKVTGQRHLDDLSPTQRTELADVLQNEKLPPGLVERQGLPGPPELALDAELKSDQQDQLPQRVAALEAKAPLDTPVDLGAHQAATSPTNAMPEPTQAQKEAGVYKHGHVSIAGMDISIENPQGSTRSGVSKSGKPWETVMQDHYGYILGTHGKDKEHIDTFIKAGTPENYSGPVFVMDQVDPETKRRFDEHKVVIGASTSKEARQLYERNYAPNWNGGGSLSTFTMPQFKEWLKSGNHQRPAVEYRVPNETPDLAPVQTAAEEKPDKAKLVPTRTPGGGIEYVVQPLRPGAKPETLTVPKELQPESAKPTAAPIRANISKLIGEVNNRATHGFDPTVEGRAESEALIKRAQAVNDDASQYITPEQLQALRQNIKHLRNKLDELKPKPVTPQVMPPPPKPVPALEQVAQPPAKMFVRIEGGKRYPVASYEEASKKVRAVIEAGDFGGSNTPAVTLVDAGGAVLGHVSYNGRVWEGREADWNKQTKLLYDPRSTPSKEALASPTKEATIVPALTTEEVPSDRPDRTRVADTRPPEKASAKNVPSLEGAGPTEADRGVDAGQGQRGSGKPGGQRPVTQPSLGDGEGRRTPAERGGRTESGGDETAVQRSGDDLPAGTDFILDQDYTVPKGQKTKYTANVRAITLLKSIEADGRLATPDEQTILAQYTGWGGLPQAFQWSHDWQKEYEQLEKLLTGEEYSAARASTPNAHYTTPDTIRAIYRGLQHLGFKGGRMLEPGAGIGHFFGAMPVELTARSQRTAIERDSLSARLTKQLYQHANVIENEYQKTTLPENFFDVIVGNVPFADVKVFDPHNKDLSKLHLSLHDYYFAKAMTQVRPGGLIAFITSRYTMDKINGKVREYLATQADLVGAIRLPDTQFKEIANTDVVTDIIVLQKREPGTPAAGASWTKTVQAKIGTQDIAINEYFKDLPEMILGKPSTKGTMYRDESYTVESDKRDMNAAIDEAFARMPEKILKPRAKPASTTPRGLLEALEASDDTKEGAFTIQNNALYVRRGTQFVPMEGVGSTDLERAKGIIGLREQVREVFKTQLVDSPEKVMVAARQELTKRYDRFSKKFGPVHGRANKNLFGNDPDYPTLQALEKTYDSKANTATKADIFTKRVIEYRPRASKADTPKEAMLVSLNEAGRLDFDRMSELTGQTPEELQRALKGTIFKDPSGDWDSADAYLSGNIRTKLKAAEAAAKIDKRYQENVDALKAVVPQDLAPMQIDVKIGHGWIPTEYYEQFIDHLFGGYRTQVRYNAQVGAYAVKTNISRGNTKNDTTYGTSRYGGTELIQDALASKLPTVYDKVEDKQVVNQKETLAAREKLQKIQDAFKDWLWDDADRAKTLGRLYNDEFNNVRLREYDGSHLTLPGSNPLITLKPHQKNAIWRALQSGNTLLGHVVGAGKTYEMIGIALESRRLRLANKPMIVVPNHLTEYWQKEITLLYPAAKVLTTAKEDFQAANRKKLLGRISTGDWDAVVIAHSQLAKVPVSVETFEAFVNEQVAVLESYLQELKQDKGGNRNIIKEIEKAKGRFESKLAQRKAEIESRADLGVSFEETGVDMLIVDESDIFKNLYFPTRMTRVAGIPNTESQRAYDMFLKTQYLNKITNGRGVIFATGTPISNSMAEVFTMQRYLQPQMLEQAGLSHFDAWARQFGNTVTSMELAPDGSGYRPRTRFAEFVNVPELTQMFRQVMDVKLAEDLKLPVPKLKTGKPINVTSKPGPELVEYTKSLIERAKNLKGMGIDPRVDNMLKITGDGRNAALDIRLRVPSAPEDKNGKVAKMVHQVITTYKETTDVKGTQLVFLDLSTPKGGTKAAKDEETTPSADVELADESRLRGSVYQDIKRKLIKGSIPEKDIAFIHDADTDAKKGKLFRDVNEGTVRVLIGSTEKMGAGTNVQKKLVALHNLDAPWRPRDLEQRIGRGVRQGNELYQADPEGFELGVYNYATEAPSFDVYMWQTLEVKAKTIAQIMKGDPNIRTIQDVDSTVLSYAEMKAIASGNPMILERVKVETELTKLKMLKSQQRDEQHKLSYELATIPGKMAQAKSEVAAMAKDREVREKHPEEPLAITIEDVKYDEADAAGEKILSYVKDATTQKRTDVTEVVLGTYRGFNLRMKVYLDGDTLLFLKRTGSVVEHRTTAFTKEANAAGIIDRLNNALKKVEENTQTSETFVKKQQARMEEIKQEIDKPFDREARITELATRMADIDKQLDLTNKDEGVVGGEGAAQSPAEILKSERGSLTFSGAPKFSKEARKYKAQRAAEDLKGFSSSDDDIESRVRAAKQGLKPEGIWTRVKDHSAQVWHLVSREFEHLPDTAQFAPLRTDLLKLAKYKGIAADQVQRDLAAIIKPLSKKQYDQFEWKALLSDLAREAEADRVLPFGYTPEKVQDDLDRLNQVIERDPLVQAAWTRRQALWAKHKKDYQTAMDAIGFDTSKKLTKEDYFRHQVLEYANERAMKGTGSKVRTPTGRGFLRTRHGSGMDINANYVQAEFEVMAQMVYDTQVAKVVAGVDRHLNIRQSLVSEAKVQNADALQRIIDEGGIKGAIVEATMKDFRQRIGMHMGMARKALDLPKGERLTLEQLAEYADDAESPAHLSALGVFKAISERKAYTKDLLGKSFKTWENLVPETHDLWQPREGNVFYMADSIPAQLAKALQEGMLEQAGLTADKLRKVMAMGNPREQYVIPVEAKATLDQLSQKEHNWFVEANRSLINHWKQLMLIAPRKAIRYNVRNLTGDADAMFVGNPHAFLKLRQAAKELVPVIFKDTVLTGEAKEWSNRGGYGSTLQMQELGDINDLKAFKHSLDKASGGWLKAPASVWNAYWKTARLSTDYRESLMRYAAYLDYLEQMQGNNGRPKNFGASIPKTVMAIPDLRDRAFKLSNELLGAYDRVSVAGQTLRSFWIPFWSWKEVNANRYGRMIRNALDGEDAGTLARGATIGAKKAAAFLIKMAFFWSMLQAWNLLMHGDDEDELRDTNPTVANRPHILFGRGDDGKIRYLAGIGALGDFLAWLGLDAAPGLVGDVMHDRMTIGEAIKYAAKAPVNILWQGISPTVKMPLEMAVRETTYPDLFNPRPIQDRGDYLANQVTLGPEVAALRGKPGKPLYGGEDLTGLVVQRTEPKAASYGTWSGIERKYLDRMGKESPGVYWRSPKGDAVANWSRAIQDHDTDATEHWSAEYERMEREKYGKKFSESKMWKDLEQTLRAKAPLAGVTIAEREAIVKQLDAQEKRTLERAETYYKETIMQVLPESRRRRFTSRLQSHGWLTRPSMLPELTP